MSKAFVLRIIPSGIDRVPEALETNDVIIGWSKAQGLLDTNLEWDQFRQVVHDQYYSGYDNFSRSGSAAGNLWRFIREMGEGDRIVVPYGDEFFVAKVTGPARHDEEKAPSDTAHRRAVKWLNAGESIPRRYARSALQSSMKYRGTCKEATDLIEEIEEVVSSVGKAEAPSFEKDLRLRLIDQTLEEIRSGRIENFGFERLIKTILVSLGAAEARIIPRSEDKGADIVANFSLAATFKLTLAVQAKHFLPEPPVDPEVVDQLVRGMEAEETDFGWIATSGTFSEEAVKRKAEVEEKHSFRIELVDGEQLAAMIVEGGLQEVYPSEA